MALLHPDALPFIDRCYDCGGKIHIKVTCMDCKKAESLPPPPPYSLYPIESLHDPVTNVDHPPHLPRHGLSTLLEYYRETLNSLIEHRDTMQPIAIQVDENTPVPSTSSNNPGRNAIERTRHDHRSVLNRRADLIAILPTIIGSLERQLFPRRTYGDDDDDGGSIGYPAIYAHNNTSTISNDDSNFEMCHTPTEIVEAQSTPSVTNTEDFLEERSERFSIDTYDIAYDESYSYEDCTSFTGDQLEEESDIDTLSLPQSPQPLPLVNDSLACRPQPTHNWVNLSIGSLAMVSSSSVSTMYNQEGQALNMHTRFDPFASSLNGSNEQGSAHFRIDSSQSVIGSEDTFKIDNYDGCYSASYSQSSPYIYQDPAASPSIESGIGSDTQSGMHYAYSRRYDDNNYQIEPSIDNDSSSSSNSSSSSTSSYGSWANIMSPEIPHQTEILNHHGQISYNSPPFAYINEFSPNHPRLDTFYGSPGWHQSSVHNEVNGSVSHLPEHAHYNGQVGNSLVMPFDRNASGRISTSSSGIASISDGIHPAGSVNNIEQTPLIESQSSSPPTTPLSSRVWKYPLNTTNITNQPLKFYVTSDSGPIPARVLSQLSSLLPQMLQGLN
ncbi:hypothetical protein H4219_005054 [Mycoemilia scoparia]|uniref:Uncharacterized protein n=1 Tax=Mycoemilia scoparia TaxID=417184 RepID=A0A9W8DLT1_9FUNG|nr:hypothetical protein H4219_005054 [Mycoemilia scoparia]